MGKNMATSRRGFFRAAGAAGAGVGLLGGGTASAALLNGTARDVWAYHPDFLYLDQSGFAVEYRPPAGARGAAGLTAEDLARLGHHA